MIKLSESDWKCNGYWSVRLMNSYSAAARHGLTTMVFACVPGGIFVTCNTLRRITCIFAADNQLRSFVPNTHCC